MKKRSLLRFVSEAKKANKQQTYIQKFKAQIYSELVPRKKTNKQKKLD